MSHHGTYNILTPDQQKALAEIQQDLARVVESPGATGLFPEGKIKPDDKGEIQFIIAHHEGKVILDFGKRPICWIGMSPEQADEICKAIQNTIKTIKEG